jgi:predicted flap endonuclease-1-like 5' DNA nuclease
MFSCCMWWLIFGVLVGWLLNWLLCRCTNCRSMKCCDNTSNTSSGATSNSTNTQMAEPPDVVPPKATVQTKSEATPKPAATAPKPSTLASTPKVFILDVAAAKAAGFKLKGPNDLTVVEGIGPKISELFNSAGITTFAQLAKQTVPQMQKVLDEAGASYKLAKPGTWAQQAGLAAENKWSELKKLQDKLSGGV